jgi:hypothetical protein
MVGCLIGHAAGTTFRSVDAHVGVRTRSDQSVTSGSFLAAVHGSPEDREVVRPSGSHRSSRSHTTAGHRGALVVIAIGGPSPGARTAPCVLLRPLPRTRLLPDPGTEGFCQGRLRVYMNQATTPEVVALRSQTALTGSGSPTPSHGGFGEDTHTSTRMPRRR